MFNDHKIYWIKQCMRFSNRKQETMKHEKKEKMLWWDDAAGAYNALRLLSFDFGFGLVFNRQQSDCSLQCNSNESIQLYHPAKHLTASNKNLSNEIEMKENLLS